MTQNRIVLAYSGGLDTTVAVPWLKEKYGAEIITLTADLGMVDLESIRQRALSIGATDAVAVDGKEALVDEFLIPSLQAGTVYEEQYPLATALGRPLIARYLVEVARQYDAYAVAHGCTGKGNDQVRLEVGVAALAPELRVIAPIRDWAMSREDEIEYAQARNLPISVRNSRFSTDDNLWGRSVEAGELEDPWLEPPEDAYAWTNPVSAAPDEPAYVELHFESGVPTAVDGESMSGVDPDPPPERSGRRPRRGPHRPRGEPAGGDQVPGDIRGPGGGGAPRRPQGFGDDDSLQRAGPDQGPHRAGIFGRDLQRPLVYRPPR